MTHCKICGKKLELTPEYDMCMECQGKQHRTFTIPNNRGSVSNKTEMTPKEALEKVFRIYDTAYGREQLTILNLGLSFEETAQCEKVINQALNELEELKRDVKRYFELEGNYQKSSHEYHEMEYIKNKLMEVGK